MQGFGPLIFYNSDLNSRTITSDISSHKPKKERKRKNSCATANDDISETSISIVKIYGNRFPSRKLGSTSTTYPYALIKALQRIPRGGTAVKTLNDELKATRSTTVRCSPGSISTYLSLIWLKDRSFTSSIQETDDTIPKGHTKKKNTTKAQTGHHNASMMLQQNTRESSKYTQR